MAQNGTETAPKRPRGRPATGQAVMVTVSTKLSLQEAAKFDGLIDQSGESKLTRHKAVRRLVQNATVKQLRGTQ